MGFIMESFFKLYKELQLKPKVYVFAILFACVLAIGGWKKPNKNYEKPTKDFDFYVLALSWSPTYCAQNGFNARQTGQCQIGANYGLIVHGLWPQFENGYPRECKTAMDAPKPSLIAKMQDIMPSERLVKIEWDRHGTCSGLNSDDYFGILRKAYNQIKIPKIEDGTNISVKKLEDDFIKANYGMTKKGIAIINKDGKFSEARICLDKKLKFRDCDEVDARASKDYDKLYITPKK